MHYMPSRISICNVEIEKLSHGRSLKQCENLSWKFQWTAIFAFCIWNNDTRKISLKSFVFKYFVHISFAKLKHTLDSFFLCIMINGMMSVICNLNLNISTYLQIHTYKDTLSSLLSALACAQFYVQLVSNLSYPQN